MKKIFLLVIFASILSNIEAQNVGIGTNGPATKLHINSTQSEVLRLQGPTAYMTLYNNDTYAGFIQAWENSLGIGVPDTRDIVFYTQTSQARLTIAVDGKIGISKRNPVAALDMFGGIPEMIRLKSTTPFISFYDNDTLKGIIKAATNGLQLKAQSSLPIDFFTSDQPRLTIQANGNIGIGTSNPLTRLHVKDSSVLFSADGYATAVNPSSPAMQGAGRRMLWYADKAAFRAGGISDNKWDKDSIGDYSFAAGAEVKASGFAAIAMGGFSEATGRGSVALGPSSYAYGDYSFAVTNGYASGGNAIAIGLYNNALGTNSTCLGGTSSYALGYGTFCSGIYCVAKGEGAHAAGYATEAAGLYSFSSGYNSVANGDHASTSGYYTKANGLYSFAIGKYNDTIVSTGASGASNPLLMIGNGNSSVRSNALVVYESGNTELNGYTRLGKASDNAPKIKMKEINGVNSAATDGAVVTVAHGLTRSKIIALNALLVYGAGDVIPGFRGTTGYEYSIAYDDVNIYIYNIAGNSANILSKPLKLTLTYKE